MNINSNYTITLGNRNIVKIMKGSTVIWEKSTTPVVTPDYFYIKNVSSGDTNWLQYKFNNQPSRDTIQQIEYSYDKQNWTTVTLQGGGSYQNLCSLPAGGTVYLRNNNGKFNFSLFYLSFKSTVNHEVGGNIYTLLDYTNPNVSLTSENTFENLFENDLGLVRAGNLTLGFDTLTERCYSLMFKGCSNLTTAPSLPATTLATGCYESMFSGCTSLTSAPTLPATTVADSCYRSMFYGCTSLTTAPSLPATILRATCYYGMFQNCTSLTTAPALPATSVALGCYETMFKGCTSLTTVPTSLPATTLIGNNCYESMFYGCTSLTTAPSLPATTLASDCYNRMFYGCTSLTTAPSLPATNLVNYCYYYMFQGCTALTTAPELPATTLATGCYSSMFDGCTSLNSVTTYADDISASGCIDYWLQNVASTGNFYNNGSAVYTIASTSGIPTGWTEVKPSTGPDYFYLENVDSNSGNVSFKFNGTPSSDTIQQIEWSKDKTNWTTVTLTANTTTNVPVSVGEKVYFRNSNGKCSQGYSNYLKFGSDINTNTGGELYTLLDYTDENVSLPNYAFICLFYQMNKLKNASDLVLRWTTLASSCYYTMFSGCSSLTTAPVLPATTLAGYCYTEMFSNCTSLTTAPALPATNLTNANGCYQNMFNNSGLTSTPALQATTLSNYCYQYMFQNCVSLTTVPSILPAMTLTPICYYGMFMNCGRITTTPALPATTIAENCYYGMFQNCASLTTVPSTLPAMTLQYGCYRNMFRQCISLTTAPSLPSTTLDNSCYQEMFENCYELLNAPTLPATTLRNSCYNGMFENCRKLTSAPTLPATTLRNSCYENMFIGCSLIDEITTYADDISATSCTYNWLSGVASSGTFHNLGSATYPSGTSGIPSGWTEVKPTNYFYIKNVGNQSGNVSFKFTGTPSSDTIQQIEWSKDRTNWTTVTLVANTTTNVPVSVGEKVYFRNSNGKCTNSNSAFLNFSSDINTNIGGELYTLLDYTDENVALPQFAFVGLFYQMNKLENASDLVLRWTTLTSYCYWSMFQGCDSLTTAPSLPATILATGCYSGMFYGCNLTNAPELPATTLAPQCYYSMFQGCSSLTTAPSLPATILATGCYSGMFSECISLTTAPSLPATILADSCYTGMFYGCIYLTTAPSLPATTLAAQCYWSMFYGCTTLNSVTIYADDISESGCLNNWLSGVASSGTFHNLGSATYPSGASGIPSGWTEVNS